MSNRISRRTFLKASAAAAGGVIAAGPIVVRACAAGESPNEKLDIAVIGVAGRGGDNLNGVSTENIVALCDVDEQRLGGAAKRFPNAKTFTDFRKMLDEVGKQVQAVVVSTPDHVHAPAAAMALRMGKHCYCEKPLTHSVYEARVLADLARKGKRVTQIGTQIHAEDNYRRVVELVQGGAIGPVKEVHVWSSASYGGMDRPKDTPPVPPHIHWDLWLGPAPERPYHPAYIPAGWRAWWDFGSGAIGDFGCHFMDLPYWALGLRYPTSVEAEGPAVHPETTPPSLTVRYEFPARPNLPPVRLTWYDGGRRPTALLEKEGLVKPETLAKPENPAKWGSGVLFMGEKGMLLADYGRRMLLPEATFADYKPPAPTIAASIGHHQEWIKACKTGGPTTCGFDYSGPLTETALLGTVAFRAGEKFQWDAKGLKAVNCPKADRYLRREYRKGWTL